MPLENTMRSELVFGAKAQVSNPFRLTMLAAQATRKLHRPNTRIQETTNEVLVRFSHANPIAVTQKSSNVQPLRRAEKVEHSRDVQRSQAVA